MADQSPDSHVVAFPGGVVLHFPGDMSFSDLSAAASAAHEHLSDIGKFAGAAKDAYQANQNQDPKALQDSLNRLQASGKSVQDTPSAVWQAVKGVYHVATDPLLTTNHELDPKNVGKNDKFLQNHPYAAALSDSAKQFLEGFTSPLSLATMGTGAVAGKVGTEAAELSGEEATQLAREGHTLDLFKRPTRVVTESTAEGASNPAAYASRRTFTTTSEAPKGSPKFAPGQGPEFAAETPAEMEPPRNAPKAKAAAASAGGPSSPKSGVSAIADDTNKVIDHPRSGFQLGPERPAGGMMDKDSLVHDVLDRNGKKLGVVEFAKGNGGAYEIRWVGDENLSNSMSNKLGRTGIKEIHQQFLKAHPDAQYFTAIRGGGQGELRSVIYDRNGRPVLDSKLPETLKAKGASSVGAAAADDPALQGNALRNMRPGAEAAKTEEQLGLRRTAQPVAPGTLRAMKTPEQLGLKPKMIVTESRAVGGQPESSNLSTEEVQDLAARFLKNYKAPVLAGKPVTDLSGR